MVKNAIVSFTILILLIQPLYGLAPKAPDLDALASSAALLGAAPVLARLKENPPDRADIQRQVEEALSGIENTQKVVPYWNTLVFNPDNSFEIVIDYVDLKARSNLVLNRFALAEDGRYLVQFVRDEPPINNRIARGMLGLDLSRVLYPAMDLDEATEKASIFRRGLIGEEPPEGGRLAYLYAVTNEKPVQEVLGAIADAQKRMGNSIKAVVVLGIGGQSLGNRAVIQMLGSQKVKFIFPANIAHPGRWLSELEGINPQEVLLYVSSKTGETDETMANFWFFWGWLIRGIGRKLGKVDIANSLLDKLQGKDLVKADLARELGLTEEEKGFLKATLNHILVSTTPGVDNPLYRFAVYNNLTIVPLQKPIEGRYTILFRSGQVTTALAGHDIEAMRQAVGGPLASALKEDKPELNPALEAAMHAYKLRSPVLVGVSADKRLGPLFEWLRQLVNESLGKEGKGPYLTFTTGIEESQGLMQAPKDKLFLVINVGEQKLAVPEGVPAIEINIPELDAKVLARIFLFLEEFTVRYGTFLGVNPTNQPWVDMFKEILTETAGRFDTTAEARVARQEAADAVKEITATGGVNTPETLRALVSRLTATDEELAEPVQPPKDESGFQGLLDMGKYKQPGEVEGVAQSLAIQLYIAEWQGKNVNPFFIYSASPEAGLLGKFIRYIGGRRIARLAELGGGVLWDYLIGTTDQHITAQFLGAGSDIALTTFLHFLQEPVPNPPVIRANGLIHRRLDGKTPHEVSTLYLQAVREALNNEGRITNTVEVPNEGEENLAKLYQLIARASELYARLVEYEGSSGRTVLGTIGSDESTVIDTQKGVSAGDYGNELPIEASNVNRVTVPMQIGGVETKGFISPRGVDTGAVRSSVGRFISRISALARAILELGARRGSALNRFITAKVLEVQVGPETYETGRREFYVFRLEDAIAKVEVGTEMGDLWEEIRVTRANTMIARTIQEIKRANPKARVIVYTEESGLTERRVNAALDAIDSANVFDMVVCGDSGRVLAKIVERGWAASHSEAVERAVFASRHRLEELKSVILPTDQFIPFPELTTVMQAILRGANKEGRLPDDIISTIVSSYKVWLELAGFSKEEITPYLDQMREGLRMGANFIVTLPIPPVPKAGSVIELLDREYQEEADIKGYA